MSSTWLPLRGRALLGAAALVLAAGAAYAHYPMVLTERSQVEPDQPVRFDLTLGHPYMRDRYPLDRPDLVRVFPPQRRPLDLSATLKRAGTDELPSWTFSYTPTKPGDYVFSIHGAIFTEPPQRQVVDYVKLILHVKDDQGAQVGWGRVLGDPMEIVPLTRPYAIPVGTTFRGQALWNDQPMLEGVVEAECFFPTIGDPMPHLPDHRLSSRTDPNGVFGITLPSPGWWLISVASDGGPGEQGSSNFLARRAVLWVEVGGTIWDAPTGTPSGGPVRASGEGAADHEGHDGHDHDADGATEAPTPPPTSPPGEGDQGRAPSFDRIEAPTQQSALAPSSDSPVGVLALAGALVLLAVGVKRRSRACCG